MRSLDGDGDGDGDATWSLGNNGLARPSHRPPARPYVDPVYVCYVVHLLPKWAEWLDLDSHTTRANGT